MKKLVVGCWLLVVGALAAGAARAAELPAGYTAVEYIGERVTVTCDGQHVEWTGSKTASKDDSGSIFNGGVPGLYQALYTTGQTVKTGDPAVGGEIVPGALFCSTSDTAGRSKLTYTVGDKTYTMGGNTTAAYKGVMRMDSGVVYWFAKHFDDWGMVQVVDLSTYVTNNLIDNSSWQDVPIKSYTPSHTGWYGILLRVGQGGGGIGPSSEPFKTTMQAGMLWNTNGLSTCTAANCNQWHRFMNDDDNGIFLYTDIPDEPRYENGGTVSISGTSLTLTTDMTFGKGTLTLVVTDTAGVEKTTALDFYEKGAHIVANMGGLTAGRSYEVGLRSVSEYGNTSYVSFGSAYFGNVTVTKGTDARTDTTAPGTFVVSRPNDSEATHFPLEVQYTVSGATPGTHYEELPLKVTIPAGAASAEVEVRPIWSGLADKSLNLTLTSKRNYFVGSPGSSTINIKGAPYDPFVRFVATTGNDSNDGCTDVTAFLTLDRALAAVSSLDHATIKVLPGTYVPTNRIDNYGRYFSHYEITSPVTILGMGSKPEDVHFKSTCTDAGNSKSRVFFVNNEAAKLKNLLITGGRSGAGNDYPNYGSLGGGGVYLESLGGTVEDCVISNCYLSGWNTGGGGIHMWNGRILRTKFVNNYSGNDRDYDFAGAALCARNGYVENCLMVNNGKGADNNGYGPVHILGNTVLMNCTIAGNHGKESAAVVVQGTSAKVINCAIFNNDVQSDGSGHAGVYYLKSSATGAQFINCAADRDIVDGIDCIMSKSGGFVNRSDRDYHLAVASVCRDSANEDYYLPPFATSATDLDGKDRMIGGAIDIGAYELQSAGPCEGGEVIEYEEGVWVVTPNPGVTEIGITDLPDGVEVIVPPTVTKVTGVPDGRIRIRDGAVDVTGKFSIKDGVIERSLSTVTVGEVVHVTAAWTSGDGTETNGVVNGSFEVPCGAVDVKVIFTPADGYGVDKTEFKLPSPLNDDYTLTVEDLPTAFAIGEVVYLDWDEAGRTMTNAMICVDDAEMVVTSDTRKLEDGKWYVVLEETVIDATNITVNGSANLILTDGSSLTIKNVADDLAAIEVAGNSRLTIYGQENGSGVLSVSGGDRGAGIGGGYHGACGTVTINGGTVTATGGAYGAGIGGGLQGAGGEVVIRNGAVKVLAGENASVIGHGSGKDNDGTVSISGGIFGMSVADGWCADGCEVRDNPDPASAADYPWTVVLFAAVTLEGLSEHATAAYTFGDGSVTNAVEGTNFKVVWGTENVKVIFTPEHNYRFKDAQETGVRALDSPIKADDAVTSPEVEGIPGTDAAPWQVGKNVTAYVSDEGVLVIGGTGAMSDFASAADVPWNPALVTAVQVANGVTLGKNALAGFADEVLVAFGSPVLSVGSMKGAMGASEPVIPEGKVLVSKEEIAAAKAETVTVDGGAVTLGVTVNTNGDLTAETKSWQPVELKGGNVKVENGKIVITIPVDSQSGFMILQSGDAKIKD